MRTKGAIDDTGKVSIQPIQVDFLQNPGGEFLDLDRSVVSRSVELSLDERMNPAADGIEESDGGERRGGN